MAKVTITANENGPYLVPGIAKYTDADGNEQETQGKMVAICRCGASANMPFCDGGHKGINFKAAKIELVFDVD
ncbi:CDGSH iron-sulfur domain-containing protein [Anaerolineales bacterium HSG24]|nr:CDGSH iron-sulfur domain-containing protein [Anaerolineales bacterium HSG24]